MQGRFVYKVTEPRVVSPDDGSVPRRVRAYTYFARTLNPTPPSRRYLDAVQTDSRRR